MYLKDEALEALQDAAETNRLSRRKMDDITRYAAAWECPDRATCSHPLVIDGAPDDHCGATGCLASSYWSDMRKGMEWGGKWAEKTDDDERG